MIVLDASLTVAWLFGEKQPRMVQAVLDSLPDMAATVPAHWPAEVSNAIATYLRRERLTAEHLQIFLNQLDALDIVVESTHDLEEVITLATFSISHDLSAYDAAYVQLALRRGAVLATLDAAMRSAAQRLSIPLLPA